MKNYLYYLIFACLCFSSVLADDLQFLYPTSHEKVAYAPGGFLKAIYTSSERTEFQLLKNDTVRATINISNQMDKDDFPRAVMNMFTDRFHVNAMILEFLDFNGDVSSFEYDFSTERPLDLNDFWRTTDFRRALKKVADISAENIEITLIGWDVEKRILNPFSRPRHPDLFASMLAFKPGENYYYLHFRNEAHELVYADTVHFYYFVSSLAEEPPSDVHHYQFHAENEDKCSYCHAELLENDCSFCHASLLTLSNLHPPAEDMECNSCHDDESDPKHELLEDIRNDPGTCFMCHSDQEEEIEEMENIHPPVEESCLICHDSHAASNEFLLVYKTNKVCKSCHDDIRAGFHPVSKHPHEGHPNPLRPDYELSCTSCHNPHASDEEALLRGNWSDLCQQCHWKN